MEQIRENAHSLLERCRSLNLSTINAESKPCASYAPFFRGESGNFYILVSELSAHTENLRKGFASVLIMEDESSSEEIYARERLSFECAVQEIAREDSLFKIGIDGLRQRHGDLIDTLCSLSDFKLFELSSSSGLYVVGFGKAFETDPQLSKFRHLSKKPDS